MTENLLFLQELENVFNEKFEYDMKALEGIKPHTFSRKHNKKIRKLIKRQRKPYFKLISTAGRRAACVIIAIVVFSASALSVKAIRKVVFDFITRTFSDHNMVDLESGTDIGYPERIENEYYISALPSGFKQTNYDKTDTTITIDYFDDDNYVLFSQYTKSMYKAKFDNEQSDFEKISDDEGQEYIMITSEESISLIWDNGEYIFMIYSNLDKDTIVNLCKSTKIKE